MRPLTLTDTLENYDVPQIFTAADATGTRYLCTLYEQTADGYHYLGVQISEPRLMAFIGGQLDLRDAYLHPEVDNALYLVEAQGDILTASTLLQPSDVTDEMLPQAGYYYDAADLTDEAEPAADTYQLAVPARDRITFSTLTSPHGLAGPPVSQDHRESGSTITQIICFRTPPSIWLPASPYLPVNSPVYS